MRNLITGIAAAQLLCFTATATSAARNDSACVSMAHASVRPMVRVMVNGQGPFRFLIDTGGDGKARVDLRLKKKLGLRTIRQQGNDDSTKKDTQLVDVVKLDRIQLGQLVFRNVEATARNYGPNIDGILAFNLFRHHLLVLDYPHKKVFIGRGRLSSRDSIRFEAPEGTPVIEGKLGSELLKIDVDSGDDQELTIPRKLGSNLTFLSPPKVVGHGTSATHSFEIIEAQVKEDLTIGSVVFPSPVVELSELFDNVNIGSRLLSHFVISLDQKHRLLRIQPPGEAPCSGAEEW